MMTSVIGTITAQKSVVDSPLGTNRRTGVVDRPQLLLQQATNPEMPLQRRL
jgi:hypothetical protein